MTTSSPTGLDDTIAGLAHLFPPGLVGGRARDDLCAVAAQLPAALSNRLYFETPLAAGERQVDLIVRVDRSSRVPGARAASGGPPPAPSPAGPAWRRVRRLAARWRSPHSGLLEASDAMWLEFDVEPGTRERLVTGGDRAPPGVFVDFDAARSRAMSPARRRALIAVVLRPLIDEATLRQPLDALHHCLDALPLDGAPASIGVMLSRGDATIRLCVGGLDAFTLGAYLKAVGWPGSLSGLQAQLRSLVTPAGDAPPRLGLVHLDIGAGVLPQVGIEFRLSRAGQPRGRLSELAFLARLEDVGLCTPVKRRALMDWPGSTVERLGHQLWPSVVTRRVNHVKIVHDGAGEVRAKGYLCLTHGVYAPRSPSAPPRAEALL